jgi:hypothetical protein
MQLKSAKCQIKRVFSGIGKESGKPYTICTIQEPGGSEFGINCAGIEGLDKLPEMENCELEAEVKITKYGVSFIQEKPPVFRFPKGVTA